MTEKPNYNATYCLATPVAGKGASVLNATLKLCFGYLRSYGIKFPNEIASTIVQYMDKDKIYVRFKNEYLSNHDTWSTVLFKPDIETIMQEIQMQRDSENKNERKDGKDGKDGKEKEKHGQLTRLAVRMIENECIDEWYDNSGYFLQYGIICVPKSQEMIAANDKMNIQIFKNRRCNSINNTGNSDNNNNNNNDNKNESNNTNGKPKMNAGRTDNNRTDNDRMDNNKMDRMKTGAEDYLTRLLHKNCGLDDIVRKNEFVLNEPLETNYLHCVHFSKPKRYTCSFGKNTFVKYISIYKDDTKFTINRGDWVDICIKETRQHKKYLCFLKNNKLLVGESINQNEFKNGYVKLDFKNCLYYFGISSIQCSCKNTKGFEFKVSLKSK